MGQYCVDANVFITAWDNKLGYPIGIFPSLWRRLTELKNRIIIIKPIFEEIEPISSSERKISAEEKRRKYPLRAWLEENGFDGTPVEDSIKVASLELEKEYEVRDISKGAGPNDILLIAYAKEMKKTVVTFEAEQKQKPRKKNNYRIPLICREQKVECITFVEMLSRLNIRI
jgi:predicted nucleic acid-binding protein